MTQDQTDSICWTIILVAVVLGIAVYEIVKLALR